MSTPYCAVPEVREMIKTEALDILIQDHSIEDETEREQLFTPILQAAIWDAEGEINGYLAKRYSVPLVKVPKMINKIAKDITIYNVFSRIGIDEGERDKTYLTRYNSAIAYLKLVAEGKVELDLGGSDPQSAAATGFKVSSQPHVFGRDNLKGM